MKDAADRSDEVRVELVLMDHAPGAPDYATEGAAGADLRAAMEAGVAWTLDPGARASVPTGLKIALPPGYEAQVRARSGLAKKHGVALVNAPGTIDADYRGEIFVLLINHGSEPFELRRGKRIAQLVVAPVARARFEAVGTLGETTRGAGGFGSTGS